MNVLSHVHSLVIKDVNNVVEVNNYIIFLNLIGEYNECKSCDDKYIFSNN